VKYPAKREPISQGQQSVISSQQSAVSGQQSTISKWLKAKCRCEPLFIVIASEAWQSRGKSKLKNQKAKWQSKNEKAISSQRSANDVRASVIASPSLLSLRAKRGNPAESQNSRIKMTEQE